MIEEVKRLYSSFKHDMHIMKDFELTYKSSPVDVIVTKNPEIAEFYRKRILGYTNFGKTGKISE